MAAITLPKIGPEIVQSHYMLEILETIKSNSFTVEKTEIQRSCYLLKFTVKLQVGAALELTCLSGSHRSLPAVSLSCLEAV